MTRDLNATTLHELLSADHAEMRSLSQEFLNAVHANDWSGADAIFGRLEQLVERHMSFEEEQVFPVFDDYPGQVPSEALEPMRSQHEDIRKALQETGISLQLHQVREPVMQALTAALDKHAAAEDAWADAVLEEFNKTGAGNTILQRLRSIVREPRGG